MFSANRGDTIKQVTSDSPFGPVYWVASGASDTYYVKLANYGSEVQDISIYISGASSGKLTVVADNDPNAANTDTETPIAPVESDSSADDGKFSITLPAWSIAVLVAS